MMITNMSLIPYRSFFDLERFFDDEWPDFWKTSPKLLSEFSKEGILKSPKVDVYEEVDNVIIEAELPGFDAKEIDVEVKNDMVKIEGKSEEKNETKDKGYYRKETSRGYCKRIIPLPVNVQEDKAEAQYDKGVLKIVIPKITSQEQKEKKVKVTVKTKN